MHALIAAALLAPADYRERFPLPDSAFGSGWGVNVQFVREDRPGEVQKIASAGFKWIRANLYWSEIEGRVRGEYRYWRYDDLIKSCERAGVRPILIFSFENPIYGSVAPRTSEQRAAFCRFVEDAVRRYRGKGVVWEMWNEPNHPTYWKPSVNVGDYIQLANEVGRTIRRVAPDEWYVGPAVAGMDWEFLQAVLEGGTLEYFDAVTVHPYRSTAPETAIADYDRLRRMIELRKPAGRTISIFNSEWGYSETDPQVDEQVQAEYAVRMYLVNLAAGVPLSIHYGWKNLPHLDKPRERLFGTVRADLSPKPAFQAIQEATRALGGYRYRLRIPTAGHIYALVFEKNGLYKVAGWSTTERGTLRLGTEELPVTRSPKYFAVSRGELGLWLDPPSRSKRSRLPRKRVR